MEKEEGGRGRTTSSSDDEEGEGPGLDVLPHGAEHAEKAEAAAVEEDLYGPDNEEYMRTPLVSPYPVPKLRVPEGISRRFAARTGGTQEGGRDPQLNEHHHRGRPQDARGGHRRGDVPPYYSHEERGRPPHRERGGWRNDNDRRRNPDHEDERRQQQRYRDHSAQGHQYHQDPHHRPY